jgi:molybdate transport system substrate-binding protein
MKKCFVGLFLLVMMLARPLCAQAREPLVVFAAASLSDALKELGADFKKEYKVDVVFNFGGSSALRLQIENGSPCDVFLAADKASHEKLIEKDLVDQKIAVRLLLNRLVVVANSRNPDQLDSLYDMQLAAGDYVAIADPKTAPAGVYAMQALTKADVLKKIEPYIVPTMDVRAALSLVQSGNAKYAIVYSTDVMAARDVNRVYLIPAKLHDPIVYNTVVVKNGENRSVPGENLTAARNFLSYLQSEHSKVVFKKYGFQSL